MRKGHEFDLNLVTSLLVERGVVSESEASRGAEVSQFSHGQSNPTYLVEFGQQKLVLRKQPPGKLLRGAHAIDREYTVFSALASTDVPVPRMRVFVEDAEVIGTPFYVCDFVEGRFFKDPTMRAASSPQERASLWGAFIKATASIHSVDYEQVGLGKFGKVGGYTARQTKVWTSQYRAAETETIEPMEKLLAWLPEALPAGDDLTTLTHGDLRVDNVIFAPDSPTVSAVLDWELSTLGHPAADLALATLAYDTPIELAKVLPPNFAPFGPDREAMGLPSELTAIDAYVEASGLTAVPKHLDYHRAFCFFRMTSILQGVYKRALQGQASAADAKGVGKLAGVCANLGLEAAERYQKDPDRLVKAAGAGAAFAFHAKATTPAP